MTTPIDLARIEEAYQNMMAAESALYRQDLRIVLTSILIPEVPAMCAELRRLQRLVEAGTVIRNSLAIAKWLRSDNDKNVIEQALTTWDDLATTPEAEKI